VSKIAHSTLLAVLVLSACTVGPNYQAPNDPEPAQFTTGGVSEGVVADDEALEAWWAGFRDPVLSGLIQQAIDGNYDLQIAGQRIREADDLIRVAGSGDLPQIGFGVDTASHRQSQTLDWPPPDAQYGEYPYYQFGFDASWEIDVFGETRRRKESARDAAEAAVENRHGVLVSLTAAVATTYVSFRAAEARLQIANEDLDTAKKIQTLTDRSFSAGQTSHLDVSEADAEVDAVEAAIPPLQAQADMLVHAMAVLLGKTPEAFTASNMSGDTTIPVAPPLPASMPSEVIARRPDIRQAERDYAEANANVGVAIAAEYPHFTIPLMIGPNTSAWGAAFELASETWQFGLAASQSLYTGGALGAKVDAAQANKQATLLTYRQTVLKAFAEVEDSLSNQAAEEEQFEAVTAQVSSSQQALDEATEQYRNGQVGFLPVLDSQRQFYAARDALVAASLSRTLANINLYKAIGGGWEGVTLPNMMADTVPANDEHG
jgi:NodT family efflux transporter outer membrane factor (OMF) lipoprotein